MPQVLEQSLFLLTFKMTSNLNLTQAVQHNVEVPDLFVFMNFFIRPLLMPQNFIFNLFFILWRSYAPFSPIFSIFFIIFVLVTFISMPQVFELSLFLVLLHVKNGICVSLTFRNDHHGQVAKGSLSKSLSSLLFYHI